MLSIFLIKNKKYQDPISYDLNCFYFFATIIFSTMTIECILCAEESQFIGIGQCNHEPICYRCIYKMRVISKNNQCPICKLSLKNIIITEKIAPYNLLKGQVVPDKQFGDLFHTSQQGQLAFDKLTEYKCFIKIDGKPCKIDKKFPSVAFLKKHLKDDHNRYMCDVCLDKKTCVLQQQKLYTYKALNRHQEKGDIDEFGNITFMHPYCHFCSRYFFDQDQFRKHINIEHMTCNVCGKLQKNRYYKNYDSLQVHYKISHYICNDQNCLAKKFIAFKNAEQLKVHRIQMHDKFGQKKIDMRDLCGFVYEGQNLDDEKIVIKDKEGIDMQDQFLNLKKCKNKALGQADQQTDMLLDPRIFYDCDIDQDDHFQDAFILKHRRQNKQGDRPSTAVHKKKAYVAKQQIQKQKPAIALQNQTFYFQEIKFIHTMNLSKLNYEDFQQKFKSILTSEDLVRFNAARTKLNKKQMNPTEFFDEFIKIMKNVSLKSAYHIFPHFIRTLTNDDTKQELNCVFINSLKKIPSKSENLLSKCQNYSDLFRMLAKEIQTNIEYRIKQGLLSIKKPVKRCKERLFQILGVVRRLKIQQMARFKYATNFGVHKDTVDYIHSHIFKKKLSQVQERLSKIETDQLIDIYIFVKYCFQAIKHSKNMQIQKNKIHQNVLQDFLFQRPQLEKQYGLKKEDLKNLDEQVQYQKIQEEKKIKQTLKEIQKKNQRKGFQIKADFNLVDKGDFPDLVVQKKEEAKKQEKFKDVIQTVKQKPATYQKKINIMFPTLEQNTIQSPKKEEIKPQVVNKPQIKQNGEKNWWQKINEIKKPEFDQQQEQRVRVRKGKKKQKWVSVKGIFN